MNGLIEQFAKFGAARLAAMLAVTLVLVGFFGFVMLRMSQPAMSVLFSDLGSQDVSAILKDLDARGIKYELRGDGQTVLVPKADVPRLRLDLARAFTAEVNRIVRREVERTADLASDI